MVGGLLRIILGAVAVHVGGGGLLRWYRARQRHVRTTAVVVDHVAIWSAAPSQNRAPRFRFTSVDGREIEAVSRMDSPYPPKLGNELRIVYDPANPEGTAERVSVTRFFLVVGLPVLLAFGVALIALGASQLW